MTNCSSIKKNQIQKKVTVLSLFLLINLLTISICSAHGLPSFTEIVKKAQPAVVNISTTQVVKQRGLPFGGQHGFQMPDYFERFFGQQIPREYKNKGLGTGFIISQEGYILTNNHVVEKAEEILVKLNDDREFEAKIIGTDPKTDIALIKIDSKKDLPFIEFGDSSKLQIGDWVLAIGNPFGLEHTVTAGIISAKGRKEVNPGGRQGYYNFIQTDASINPGNSGGPLIDLEGNVIGINTAINAAGQGIGFAIPVNMAKKLLPQLKSKGKVTRSWIGIRIQKITDELAKSFGMKETRGALVSEVVENGPADKAGIKSGDVILEFDGEPVKNSNDLPWLASMAGVGKKVNIKVYRDGYVKTLSIKLGEMPDNNSESLPNSIEEDVEEKTLGLKIKNLTKEMQKSLGIQAQEGVVVADVNSDSKSFEAGVRRGDIIVKVNSTEIKSVKSFIKTVEKIKDGGVVRLFIKRQGGSLFLAFEK